MNFHEFCAQFGALEHVVQIGKRYFYDPAGLHRDDWDIFSVGMYLGEEKKTFKPSSALITLLATEKKVVLNEKATWLFLCGRDVFMGGVVAGEFPKNELVFVVDERENVLGYGKIAKAFSKKKSHIYIQNLLDKGEYLRRER
ncbi:MAG: hypothetical protein OXR66_07615 [Candidatus Woesearchaeota archaeon]|nr:hypothetical protein [Candidatus Woesearchaeota archaeon]